MSLSGNQRPDGEEGGAFLFLFEDRRYEAFVHLSIKLLIRGAELRTGSRTSTNLMPGQGDT